ncbi:MAG: SET domain-containing protein [Patescibacteria group bacterium]
MQQILPSDKIYVIESTIPGAGRGVFARRLIKKGEIIEVCPFIALPSDEMEMLGSSHLVTYIFFYGKDKEKLLLTLGYGSIYNHSYEPNASYQINEVEQTITFTATRGIAAHDEITFNYKHGNPENKLPLWFEAAHS